MADNIQTQEMNATDSQLSNTGSFSDNVYILTQNNCDLTSDLKEDMTKDELAKESNVLIHPINWTDPIVWHDPTIETGVIVKKLETDVGDTSAEDNQQTSHMIDAVYFPLIKFNENIIANNDIIYMKLESKEILPTLSLRIIDRNGAIIKTNSTGLNNSLLLVITAPVNGVYKKIKLNFYITEVTPYNEGNGQVELYISSILKIPELTHKFNTSMNYPNKNQFPGCDKCKQTENTKPNSWEMLHYIANYCKLGFASTKKCKDISDRSYRLFNAYESLEDCLYKEKEFAGTDEETAIFDWWVDVYNYIVMVNVPYVLNDDITVSHLGIYAIPGIQPTSLEQQNDSPKVVLVNRSLSNSKNYSTFSMNHNMMIRDYKIVSDNSLYLEGTCSTNNIFMPKGAGGENGLDIFDIQTQESSIAGREFEKYTSKQTYMKGIDMSGFGKHKKESIFKKYFQKKRAKMLIVELENFNLGLQRGTLVNIIITENDPKIKSVILNNPDNLFGDINEQAEDRSDSVQTHSNIKTTGEIDNQTPTNEDYVQDNMLETINYALSGLYYIDGITFEFDTFKEQRIYQKLFLIKKGNWANYMAPNAPIHINKNIHK